ncbi:hypothetical protein DFJ74DRAFT_704217 [Hyaloraphidium curvatum]|nr:hypothetical protein DFJ74DRAFT_704217 [Hyaloraphidium curvatum]
MPPLATLSDRARVPAGDLLPSDLEHPEFSLEAYEAASLPPELSEWCFNLVRDNMRDTYIAASWPWDDAEKRKEMAEPGGRYFVARPRGGGDPAGMVYFQFLMEDDGDRDDGKQLCAAYWWAPMPGSDGVGLTESV